MAYAIRLEYPRIWQGYEITHYKLCAIKVEMPRPDCKVCGLVIIYLMPGWIEDGVLTERTDVVTGLQPIILNAELFDELAATATEQGVLFSNFANIIGQFLIRKQLVPNGTLVEC